MKSGKILVLNSGDFAKVETMQRIILCEGKVDAILISYMLNKLYGWAFDKDLTHSPPVALPADNLNETMNWYSKDGRNLAIWGIGGYSQIGKKIKMIADRTKNEGDERLRFSHLVIICDRDTRTDDECLGEFKEWLADADISIVSPLESGEWLKAKIQLNCSPPLDYEIEILLLLIPPDSPGEMETFLLNTLENSNKDDKIVVKNAREFIRSIPDDPYLSKKRFRPKACLGSVLSVISPDWVFSNLDSKLRKIDWSKLEELCAIWKKLSII